MSKRPPLQEALLQSTPERILHSKTQLQMSCSESERPAQIFKSWRELLIMLVIPRRASAIGLPPCVEKPAGRHQLIFATINRLTLVVTSPQTQCVVFVRQPLQTQTVGTIHHCQIIRNCSASSEATKHYAREVTIAYLKPTKSIVLSGTIPILTKDSKRRRNGGAAPSLLTISSQACQAVCKN